MNELIDKYKNILEDFDKKYHAQIALLLDIVINYVKYMYNNENINFKVTVAFVIVMLFKNTETTKKNIYSVISDYKNYYNNNFIGFMSQYSSDITNDINYDFCQKYINEYERGK